MVRYLVVKIIVVVLLNITIQTIHDTITSTHLIKSEMI